MLCPAMRGIARTAAPEMRLAMGVNEFGPRMVTSCLCVGSNRDVLFGMR
jgi:hypothetical protein